MKHNKPVALGNSYNNICDKDGVYVPEEDMTHRRAVKQGDRFPLYKGKIVRWVLVG